MPDQDVPCPDPDEVVTRRILREELEAYTARDEVKAMLEEFRLENQLWLKAMFDGFRIEFEREIAGWFRGMQEAFLAQVNVVLEPLDGIPARTTRLESTVVAQGNRIEALETRRRVTRGRRKPTATKRKRR